MRGNSRFIVLLPCCGKLLPRGPVLVVIGALGTRHVLAERAQNCVLIVRQIAPAVGTGVVAIPLTAETRATGAGELTIQAPRDKAAGMPATAAAEATAHAGMRVVNLNLSCPAPRAWSALAALKNHATDACEAFGGRECQIPRSEAPTRYFLDSIEVAHRLRLPLSHYS